MKKIVVLNGSFNPPTKAHLTALTTAMDLISADYGYFCPVSEKYIKSKMGKKGDSVSLSDSVRLAMLESMVKTNPRLGIFRYEIEGADSNRTYETYCEVQRRHPDCEIYHLAGADKIRSLKRWYNIEDFLQNFKTLVFCRDDIDVEKEIAAEPILAKHRDSFVLFSSISEDAELNDVSATKVRRLFMSGDTSYLSALTPGVGEIMKTLSPADFPEPTLAEWISSIQGSGEMHWKDKVYKRIYTENQKYFAEHPESEERLDLAKVYCKEFKLSGHPGGFNTEISCVNKDQISAARDLLEAGLNPAIVAASSRKSPAELCVDGMNNLSENEIARQSNLISFIYQFGSPRKKTIKESGIKIKETAYPLDIRFGAIYSPDVLFFRDNLKNSFQFLDTPFRCSVITSAPLCFVKSDRQGELTYKAGEDSYTPEGRSIMAEKVRTILRVAIENGHDSIVLSEFGTRSCGLPKEETVKIFSSVFQEPEFSGRLKTIVFALPEGKRSADYDFKSRSKNCEFYKEFC